MREILGRGTIENNVAVKPRRSEHPRGIINSELEETAEFFRNPPRAIVVEDCYIPNDPNLAEAFMHVRTSLGSNIFHSSCYQSLEERPIMLSFASVHAPRESAGSEKIAGLLIDREVPPEKIITLKSTITTTGDVRQLDAISRHSYLKGPFAIVTSDGHAKRARQEVINLERAHKKFWGVRVYILHPSHLITSRLIMSGNISPETRMTINSDMDLGRSGKLKHGPMEGLAWALSAIPVLEPLQQRAEEATHEDMRHKEQSRYVARGMQKAAGKLRFYRQILIEAGCTYRSKEEGKIEPDEGSAMALAPGLFTRIAERSGPNDKELKIQTLTAKLPKLPYIPPHG